MGIWFLVLAFAFLMFITADTVIYKIKQKKRIERKEIDQVRKERGW